MKKYIKNLFMEALERDFKQAYTKPIVVAGKSVSDCGVVTNDCRGIVGSFGCFNKRLRDAGFAGKRVLITYTEIE